MPLEYLQMKGNALLFQFLSVFRHFTKYEKVETHPRNFESENLVIFQGHDVEIIYRSI